MSSFFRPIQSVLAVFASLGGDAIGFLRSSISSRTALVAENLFLRKQLAFYQEHQIRPRRLTNAARISLVFWSRFFEWKSALLIVKPATLIGWHRHAFSLFWKWRSRSGRPRLPQDLRKLIRQLVHDNPTWGEERIADEFWLKLGIRISPRTVRAYWPAESPPRSRIPSQSWHTFIHNHAQTLLACDFMVAVSARFRIFICIRGDGDRFPSDRSLQRHGSSHSRVDYAAATGGDTERPPVSLPDPRSAFNVFGRTGCSHCKPGDLGP